MEKTVAIRRMELADAQAVAALLPDLGYDAPSSKIAARLDALREWPDQEAFVACANGSVVGFCQVQGVRLLASDGYSEIQAVVVAPRLQRCGIGSSLVEHAVQWSFSRGYSRVRLRSGIHREAAHEFYRRLGFAQSRASYAFEITGGEVAG